MEKICLDLGETLSVSARAYSEDANLRAKSLNSSSIPERVKSFWNHLPVSIKNSENVNIILKSNLESFKWGYQTARLLSTFLSNCEATKPGFH